MVQRDKWDTAWGAKKINFLIRDIDGPAMTAAPVESCRFVVLRSPGSRFWSVRDVRKRLHRMRGRFHRYIYMATLPASHRARAQVPQVLDPELSGEPQAHAHAVSATNRPQTYPGGCLGADLHPKKVNNLDPMAPRSRKKRKFF